MDKLEENEMLFAEKIDDWYLEEKENLKGAGPHWLGQMKETAKLFLNIWMTELRSYVRRLKENHELKK